MSRLPISAAIAAALLAVALSPPPCFAQCDRTMANTSKEGSLLIWPLVKVGTADTIVKLNNEYSKGVKVRCVYRIPVWSRLNGAAGVVGLGGSVSGRETSDQGYILWLPPCPTTSSAAQPAGPVSAAERRACSPRSPSGSRRSRSRRARRRRATR